MLPATPLVATRVSVFTPATDTLMLTAGLALVSTPADGVPRFGVTRAGLISGA